MLQPRAEAKRSHPGIFQLLHVVSDACFIVRLNAQAQREDDRERPEELSGLHNLTGLDRLESPPPEVSDRDEV